jgi:hypothetical protein
VLTYLVCEVIAREKSLQDFNQKNVELCLQSICEFVRILFAYKMESAAEDLLQRTQALKVISDVRPHLFVSCLKTVQKACSLLLGGKLEGPEKIRKNKVKKCLELINKLLWFCLPRSQDTLPFELAIEFIRQESNWKSAVSRPEPWQLAHTILVHIFEQDLVKIVESMLENVKNHLLQIACLLSTDWLLPLQALPDIRKSFGKLRTLLQEHILQLSSEKQQFLLRNLVERIMKEQQITLSEGIRSLLTYLLLEK